MSGPNADNSRFIAEFLPRLLPLRLDYEDLELEDFKRQVDQRRQDEFEFLAEGRRNMRFLPGFIDYATAFFNYEWAEFMISYPMNYSRANGHNNRNITPEYYDFLQEIPLVDEKAIGVSNYHTFLDADLGLGVGQGTQIKYPRLPICTICWVWSCRRPTRAQLDSLYKKEGRRPSCRKWSICQRLVCRPEQAQLDSLYEEIAAQGCPKEFDLSKFGLSQTAQAQLDSFFEKVADPMATPLQAGRMARVDTTGTGVVFLLPAWKTELEMESGERLRNCPNYSIGQRLVYRQRPWPNSTPCTNIANRSSCPRNSIYRNWV